MIGRRGLPWVLGCALVTLSAGVLSGCVITTSPGFGPTTAAPSSGSPSSDGPNSGGPSGAATPSSGTAPSAAAPSATAATGGVTGSRVYVGAYAEDPRLNPEDPTIGSMSLVLPTSDAPFFGSLSFSYLGCQGTDVGAIRGVRLGDRLQGDWSGTLDAHPQRGAYTGTTGADGGIRGTYTVAGGKQRIAVPGCVDYVVAPKGTWALFPAGSTYPDSAASLTVSAGQARWARVPGATTALAGLYDSAALAGNAPAADVWQGLLPSPTLTRVTIPAGLLTRGHRYLAVVSVYAGVALRYSSSVTFTAG